MGDFWTTMTCQECAAVFTIGRGHSCERKTVGTIIRMNIPPQNAPMTQEDLDACREVIETTGGLADMPADMPADVRRTLRALCFCAEFYRNYEWMESHLRCGALLIDAWVPDDIPKRIGLAVLQDCTFGGYQRAYRLLADLTGDQKFALAREAAQFYFGLPDANVQPTLQKDARPPATPKAASTPEPVIESQSFDGLTRAISFDE